jgi:hypothetical protein
MPEPEESVQHSSGLRREERPVERLLERSPKKSPAINKFNSFYIAARAGRQSQLIVCEEFVGRAAAVNCAGPNLEYRAERDDANLRVGPLLREVVGCVTVSQTLTLRAAGSTIAF